MPKADCLGQKILGKPLRCLRGEKVPEVLRLQKFFTDRAKNGFREFQGPPKGISPGELLDVTFDTSFGSFVICDITSDCGLVLSLCDQAGKGVEMVRVFQSSG